MLNGDKVQLRGALKKASTHICYDRTTLSSKILSSSRDYFAELATNAILRMKGNTDLQNIQIVKKVGGKLEDSYLDDGFILDKKIGVGQEKRIGRLHCGVSEIA